MNVVILSGRLTRDIELQNSSKTSYCRFTLAINRNKDEVDFISCTAFGKTAELLSKYTKKGDMINVQGRLQTSSYENNGNKIYKTDVIVDRVEFASNKSNNHKNNKNAQDEEFPF